MRYARATGVFLAVIALNAALSRTACGQDYKKGDEVVVLRDADLKRGTEIVGTVRGGEKLNVEQVQGNWLFVRSGGARGWVNIRNVAGKNGGGKAGQSAVSLTGPRVAIYNLVGNVELVPGTGDSVEVDVQRGGRDAARLRIVKGDIDGRQTLRVIYPANLVVTPAAVFGGIATVRVGQDGRVGKGIGSTGHNVVVMGAGSIMSPAPSGPRLEAHARLIVRVPPGRDVEINVGVGNIRAAQIQGAVTLHTECGEVVARDIQGETGVESGNGNLVVEKTGAGVKAKADNGTIHVANAEGNVDVESGNQDIEVADVSRSVKARAENGRIQVARAKGDVDAQSGNGDIELTDIAASVKARTENGSVRIVFAQDALGSLQAHSGNGSISLEVGARFVGLMDLRTASGSIDVDVPNARVVSGDEQRKTVAIGQGGEKSSATTDNGSIDVRQRTLEPTADERDKPRVP